MLKMYVKIDAGSRVFVKAKIKNKNNELHEVKEDHKGLSIQGKACDTALLVTTKVDIE